MFQRGMRPVMYIKRRRWNYFGLGVEVLSLHSAGV